MPVHWSATILHGDARGPRAAQRIQSPAHAEATVTISPVLGLALALNLLERVPLFTPDGLQACTSRGGCCTRPRAHWTSSAQLRAVAGRRAGCQAASPASAALRAAPLDPIAAVFCVRHADRVPRRRHAGRSGCPERPHAPPGRSAPASLLSDTERHRIWSKQ